MSNVDSDTQSAKQHTDDAEEDNTQTENNAEVFSEVIERKDDYDDSNGDETNQNEQPPADGEFKEKILNTRLSEENKENSMPANRKLLLRGQSQVTLPVKFE